MPTIYHPHDLQHIHLPEFFTKRQRLTRERWYRTLSRQAAMVAVGSQWVRQDLIRSYGLTPEKVIVVPLAPILDAYRQPSGSDLEQLKARYLLPERFFLYPAQTWPHKNHAALLEALAIIRAEQGLIIPLVCTGRLNEHHLVLRRLSQRLGIDSQVTWLGFLGADELRALFGLAEALVVPSLFEAASGPLWDAFQAGVPAACSDVTSLPEQAGDAALIFDPREPRSIADAITRIWTDGSLRKELVRRGALNVRRFSWAKTARIFRAHYRRITEAALTRDDRELLAQPAPF